MCSGVSQVWVPIPAPPRFSCTTLGSLSPALAFGFLLIQGTGRAHCSESAPQMGQGCSAITVIIFTLQGAGHRAASDQGILKRFSRPSLFSLQ